MVLYFLFMIQVLSYLSAGMDFKVMLGDNKKLPIGPLLNLESEDKLDGAEWSSEKSPAAGW